MEHEGALFTSFHCVLRSVINLVEVLEVLRLWVHKGEISLAKMVKMVDGPALRQPLPTVPRTEEMSAIRHDLSDCTHTTLVLISDYSHVGPVHRWVRPMNESPEFLPTCAVLITKDYCKSNRRHVSICGHTITRKQSVLAEIQVARISRE